MPNTLIYVFAGASLAVNAILYWLRFSRHARGTYQVNPMSPLAWIVNGILVAIFQFAAHVYMLFAVGLFSIIMNCVLLAVCLRDMREKKNTEWKVEIADRICFVFAIAAAVTFIFTRNPVLGVIITFAGQILADLPQLRKAYVAPTTDGTIYYLLPALYQYLLIGTLNRFNFVGLAGSLGWEIFLTGEAAWLFYCTRRVHSPAIAQPRSHSGRAYS